ncbi:MAG: hypothetical protein IJ015_02290 [Ruminococcus sp.]|nr:hypothetical protein [Ruminococcus sp.]
MKKASVFVAVVLMLSILLCACGGGGNKIVGTWTGSQDGVAVTISFNEDGTGVMTAMIISVPFTYTAENGVLKMEADESMADIADFTDAPYKVDGDTLILGEGEEMFELTRLKQ